MDFAIAWLRDTRGFSASHRTTMRPQLASAMWVFFAFLVCTTGINSRGEDPLHLRIDQCMAEIHPGPEVSLCSDGEFLRRVYLDFIGRIPTGEEARPNSWRISPRRNGRRSSTSY